MEIITATGSDKASDLTGNVYVVTEIPKVAKSKLYLILKESAKLYEKYEPVSKVWRTGGSRRHPIKICVSLYDLPEDLILGWSFVQWYRGYPYAKREGVAKVFQIPSVPLSERMLEHYGIYVGKEELQGTEYEGLLKELYDFTLTPVQSVQPAGQNEARVKSALEHV